MSSKKWIKLFSLFSFSTIFFIFIVNVIVDPLKLLHKPYLLKDYLNSNMRLQAAGIIKNYNFDSIILGTSMLENTSSKKASTILGGDFVNISMSDSDFYERSLPLKSALKQKNLKKVIYSLDYIGLIDSRMGQNTYPISNFNYLYDDNIFNDLKSYISLELPKCLIKLNFKPCFGRKVNLDRPNEWFSNIKHSSRFGGLDKWFEAKNNSQIKNVFQEILESIEAIKRNEKIIDNDINIKINTSKEYLRMNLIKYVKKYNKTNFYFIIPPYSRVKNSLNAQYRKSDFERIKKSILFLVNESKKYPNMKIFGWGDKSFTEDISLYKDLGHYHPKINHKMLSWIKENRGLLNNDNIKNYLNTFEDKSLKYDLISFGDKISNYLNNH